MSFETGRTLRVVLDAIAGEFHHVNVLHYDLHDDTTTGGSNNPQSLADFFRDNVMGRYAAIFTSNWTIQPVLVEEEIDPLDPHAPRQAWSSGTTRPGLKAASTDALPYAMCTVTKLQSDVIGRRYTGRMFVSGQPHEGDQASGTWNAAWLLEIDNYIAAIPKQPDISEGPSGSTANWAVYSRTARAAQASKYLAHIQSFITRPTVHWLRSRQV